MISKARSLFICSGLLFAATSTAHADPVVLDAWNRSQPLVTAATKTKEGWPWGWYPQAKLYVKYKGAERDDVVVVQHLRDGRAWGKPENCRFRRYWDRERGIVLFECRGVEAMAVNRPGRYGMRVSYKAMGAGKTFKDIAKFHYKVIKYKKDNRTVKRRWRPSPGFVVDHDFRIGEAWLSVVDKGPTTPTQLRLRVWYKRHEIPSRPKARCFLEGKKVATSDAERAQTTIEYRHYKGRNKMAKPILWAKHYWHFFKLAHSPPKKKVGTVSHPGVFYISQHPGKYRCVATASGDTLATFYFEVGSDGKIKRPACQSLRGKGINTLDSMHLIRVEYGKGANIRHDERAFHKDPMYGKKLPKGCLYK